MNGDAGTVPTNGEVMDKIQQEMAQLIEGFVAQIEAAARKAAMDALGGVFGGNALPVRARNSAPSRTQTPGHSPQRLLAAPRALADGASIEERVVARLEAHPGQRMDELRRALRLPTKRLTPAVRRLAKQGMVRHEGNTRGRTYFAVGGATSARATAKAGRRPVRGRRRRS